MYVVYKIKEHGIIGVTRKVIHVISDKTSRNIKIALEKYYIWATRKAQRYMNPTSHELRKIEDELNAMNVEIHDYSPSPHQFTSFQKENYFPPQYHGGTQGLVWDEKLLEHWIAAERLDLMNWQPDDIYLDVAASNSPWAKVLRERLGIEAFAIDAAAVGNDYKQLPFYRVENATATSFGNETVQGASLQCAYEMFTGEDDTKFIKEIARILKPGGKVIILPLYMHTHYCSYSTPEFYGQGYSDPKAKEYVRIDTIGVPSSRKYNAEELKRRVLGPIRDFGMDYKLLALRNQSELGKNIYCHFILEITKLSL